MTGVVLRTEGLVKDYGKVRALAGVDLKIHDGEVFGFLGPNGAGNSTAIRVLLDLLRPTAGRAEVFGVTPRAGGPALRSRIGYLPGERAMAGARPAGSSSPASRGYAAARAPTGSDPSLSASTSTSTGPSAGCRRATSRRSASCRRSCTVRSCSSSTSRQAGSTHCSSGGSSTWSSRPVTATTCAPCATMPARPWSCASPRAGRRRPVRRSAGSPRRRGHPWADEGVQGATLRCLCSEPDALLKAAAGYRVVAWSAADRELEDHFLDFYRVPADELVTEEVDMEIGATQILAAAAGCCSPSASARSPWPSAPPPAGGRTRSPRRRAGRRRVRLGRGRPDGRRGLGDGGVAVLVVPRPQPARGGVRPGRTRAARGRAGARRARGARHLRPPRRHGVARSPARPAPVRSPATPGRSDPFRRRRRLRRDRGDKSARRLFARPRLHVHGQRRRRGGDRQRHERPPVHPEARRAEPQPDPAHRQRRREARRSGAHRAARSAAAARRGGAPPHAAHPARRRRWPRCASPPRRRRRSKRPAGLTPPGAAGRAGLVRSHPPPSFAEGNQWPRNGNR